MFLKRYKIIIAYDGTNYHGWQIQPSDITIASTLQRSFKTTFSKNISLVGASRTDAGVHALGQTGLVICDLDLPPERLRYAWNNALPNSIFIRSATRAEPQFHIFADVVLKTYYYHLFIARPLPFIARYGWRWQFIPNVDFTVFEKAMNCFVGKHDFRSFCRSEPDEYTVRTIDSIKIEKFERFGAVRIVVKGKGFLRY